MLQGKKEESARWMDKLRKRLEKTEKPYKISWDFSDITPTLKQNLKKKDASLIGLLIDVLNEKVDLAELEKELKRKGR